MAGRRLIDRLRLALFGEAGRPRLDTSLSVVLGLFVYRPLLLSSARLPGRQDFESWFFEPENKTTMLVLGVAGWMLWRRRESLASLAASRARGATFALLALGVGLFVWAQLTRNVELLLPSLAANLLALAGWTKGRTGSRVVLLPALVLLLPILIPLPIRDELVWRLQIWSASGALWLMQQAGYDVLLYGVMIVSPTHSFIVIESCSGLRGIEVLIVVALVIRELFAASGRRQWLLLLVVPWLGYVLNVLRVFVIAVIAMAGPEVPGPALRDHTAQGVIILAVGTGLLYAMGLLLAGGALRRGDGEGPRASRPERHAGGLGSRGVLAWLLVLATSSIGLPPFAIDPAPDTTSIEMPESKGDWTSTRLPAYGLFLGPLPRAQAFYRRYERRRGGESDAVVDVFIVHELAGNRSLDRLFTSKVQLPTADWSIGEVQESRVWSLDQAAELVAASRDEEHIISYIWRLRDEGIWLEALRTALALDSSPLRRERLRTVVRLTTPLAFDGPLARDRAKQVLDRFILEFKAELAAL